MCEEYVFKNMSLTDKLKNIGGELFWSACLLALSTQIIVANKEIVFGGAKFAASYVLYSTAFARPLKPPIQTNPPPVAATQASPSPTPATQPGPSPKNTSATQTNPSPAATTQAGSSPTTATQAVSSFDYTNPKAIAISLVGIDWLVFLFITGFALWGACLRRPPLGWAPKLLRASLLFVTGQMTVALTVLGVASGIAGAAGGGGH